MNLRKKKDTKKTEQEKVDERREEVLSKGRKFKYPLQWTKHRIVTNTILISFAVVSLVVVGIWLGLYKFNMTDDFLFRITEVVPVSVAKVDGEEVRFSDYLMFYRSSMASFERQSGNSQYNEGSVDDLRNEYKRSALTEAEQYSYALKLAKEQDITVSDEDVAKEFDRHLKVGGVDRSEDGFVKIIKDNFGLDKSEYERMLYLTLIKSKVEMSIDESANKIAGQVEKLLSESNNDYIKVAEELGDKIIYEETGGLVDSKNIDGGRASEAMKLEPEQGSSKFISTNGDGYYFVKLIKKTDTEVNFVSIKIPFTEFDKRFENLQNDNKITEYINIATPDDTPEYIPEP